MLVGVGGSETLREGGDGSGMYTGCCREEEGRTSRTRGGSTSLAVAGVVAKGNGVCFGVTAAGLLRLRVEDADEGFPTLGGAISLGITTGVT